MPVTQGISSRPTVGDLQALLHDRELRLQEITEQCLGLLDQLVEARNRPDDRAELVHRISKLEEVLANTRRRVRHAGGTVLHRSSSRAKTALTVVCWQTHDSEEIPDLAATLEAVPNAPVVWVGAPDRTPASIPKSRRLQILAMAD